MPAKRSANFRAGDLSEDLGILFLKSICFVAPVPRTEDVGIDAVCTLYRKEKNLLFAEDSFWVQLKSSSTPKIEYNAEQVQWLKTLKLPFFIGIVEKEEPELKLYCLNALNGLLIGNPSKIIINCSKNNSRIRTRKRKPEKENLESSKEESWEIEISLPEPLISLTWDNIRPFKRLQKNNVYEILKAYLPLGMTNIESRNSVGNWREINWSADKLPHFGKLGNIQGLHNYNTFSKLNSYIQPAILTATLQGDRELLKKFQNLVEHLRAKGTEVDCDHSLRQTLEKWNSRDSVCERESYLEAYNLLDELDFPAK
jgi:hypothetical protein